MAGGSLTPHAWYCSDSTPSGSLHNAAGMLCFDTLADCSAAPNACVLENPCEFGLAECQTGVATRGALTHNLVCPTSVTDDAVINGGGCVARTQSSQTAALPDCDVALDVTAGLSAWGFGSRDN